MFANFELFLKLLEVGRARVDSCDVVQDEVVVESGDFGEKLALVDADRTIGRVDVANVNAVVTNLVNRAGDCERLQRVIERLDEDGAVVERVWYLEFDVTFLVRVDSNWF